MAVTGSARLLQGLSPALFFSFFFLRKIVLLGSYGRDIREGVTVALGCRMDSSGMSVCYFGEGFSFFTLEGELFLARAWDTYMSLVM